MKHLRFIRVSYIVGWEPRNDGLYLMYSDGQRELISMSAEEADENDQFMVDNMFEDNRDVIGIEWEEEECSIKELIRNEVDRRRQNLVYELMGREEDCAYHRIKGMHDAYVDMLTYIDNSVPEKGSRDGLSRD